MSASPSPSHITISSGTPEPRYPVAYLPPPSIVLPPNFHLSDLPEFRSYVLEALERHDNDARVADPVLDIIGTFLQDDLDIPNWEDPILEDRRAFDQNELARFDAVTHLAFTRLHPHIALLWDRNRDCDLRIILRQLGDLYHEYAGYAPYVHTVPNPPAYINDLHASYPDILDALSHHRFIDTRRYIVGDFLYRWPDVRDVWPHPNDIPNAAAVFLNPSFELPIPSLSIAIRIDWAPNGHLELTLYENRHEDPRIASFTNRDPEANARVFETLPYHIRFGLQLFVIPYPEYIAYVASGCSALHILPSRTHELEFIHV
ncbi:hypothetical protein C8T65DRAFT_676303, partial [Cerioporus squamosus]